MIEQSEERLFLTAQMTVERPCKNSLRANHERQLRIHAAAAWLTIPASAACGEFIEPDRRGEISFGQQCLKSATQPDRWDKNLPRRKRHMTYRC